MQYEIYIDSLFLLNFTMNLYLLLLTAKSFRRTVTRGRIVLGAAMGGCGYCLMFFIPFFNVVGKILFGAVFVNLLMLFWVFKPCSMKAFFRLYEVMLRYALLMGGGFLLLKNQLKGFREHQMTVTGVLLCGGIFFLMAGKAAGTKTEESKFCKVLIQGTDGKWISLQAIVDTGNCLREPISGSPVSVVEKGIFESIWGERPKEGFRAIPYRSVGCKRGIMEGYEIPEIVIEQEGMRRICKKVYVGVSKEEVSSFGAYQMLLHPEVLLK